MKFFITLIFLLLSSTLTIHLKRKDSLNLQTMIPFTVKSISIEIGNTKTESKCLESFSADPLFSKFLSRFGLMNSVTVQEVLSSENPTYGIEFTRKEKVADCEDIVKKYFIQNKTGKYVLPFEYIRKVESVQDQSLFRNEFAEIILNTGKEDSNAKLTITFKYGIGKRSREHLIEVINAVKEKQDKQFKEVQTTVRDLVQEYNKLQMAQDLATKDAEEQNKAKERITQEISDLKEKQKQKEEKIDELRKKIEMLTKEKQDVLKDEEISVKNIKANKAILEKLQEHKSNQENVENMLDNLKPFITEEKMMSLKAKAVELVDNGKDLTEVIKKIRSS